MGGDLDNRIKVGASTGARTATCPHGVGPSVALANAASPHANNLLSLRLGQTTTQDGVRGLALRQGSTDLSRTAWEDRTRDTSTARGYAGGA